MKRLIFALLTFTFLVGAEEPRPSAATIRQWQSRKYGMFIHFGLFSALGGVWKGTPYSGNYSEQIQSDAQIAEPEYAALAAQFNPTKWDADAIVKLAEEAGMKFIVLTAKHHDGFNMFDTKQDDYSIVKRTPYGRDVVKSLADACRRRHMPFGVYYSSIDWHFGDAHDPRNDNPISAQHEEFNAAQLRELMTNYGPISEIWFDMGHSMPLQSQHFADTVHKLQPECLIGGRVFNSEGDFGETGDDDIPDYVTNEPWESPASIFSETWGYRSWQKRVPLEDKVHEHILRLVKVVSRGGNYLLNIGPKGDGSVVDYEADVLRGTGEWLRKNGAAIYDTTPQPFRKLEFGYATVKGHHLYLFVEHAPADGKLQLPGMQNAIRKARWLGGNEVAVEGKTVMATAMPGSEFLPVVDVELDGDLRVLPVTRVEPDAHNEITLTPENADKLFNTNGEGYYDPPTLRAEIWHAAVKQEGRYEVEIRFKRAKFSRLVDVRLGDKVLKANLYGNEADSATAGPVELGASEDLVVKVEPGAPAVRGAKLDLEITKVVLRPVEAKKR